MTTEQKQTWNAKKLSRTWRLVVYWMVLAPLSLVGQIILAALHSPVELPLGMIIGGLAAASTAFMGKRAVQEYRKHNE